MEAVNTSETSVDNHFTRQYNPEDSSEYQRLYDIKCDDKIYMVTWIGKFVAVSLFINGSVSTALDLWHQ
jgi:hypothetical protein